MIFQTVNWLNGEIFHFLSAKHSNVVTSVSCFEDSSWLSSCSAHETYEIWESVAKQEHFFLSKYLESHYSHSGLYIQCLSDHLAFRLLLWSRVNLIFLCLLVDVYALLFPCDWMRASCHRLIGHFSSTPLQAYIWTKWKCLFPRCSDKNTGLPNGLFKNNSTTGAQWEPLSWSQPQWPGALLPFRPFSWTQSLCSRWNELPPYEGKGGAGGWSYLRGWRLVCACARSGFPCHL